jgi:hypothetical protein
MAVMLNSTVGVKIATVDISDHVSSATLSQIFDELEITSLGDLSHKFTKGLEASTLSLDFFNDFAIEEKEAFLETRIRPGLDIEVVETIKRSLQEESIFFHREDIFGTRAILGLEHKQIIDPLTQTPKGIDVGPRPRLGIDKMFKRGHLLMKIRDRCT